MNLEDLEIAGLVALLLEKLGHIDGIGGTEWERMIEEGFRSPSEYVRAYNEASQEVHGMSEKKLREIWEIPEF